MQSLTLKQYHQHAQAFLAHGVGYEELDKFCESDVTQNKVISGNLTRLLEMVYVGTGKIPVFTEDKIIFEQTKHPVISLPQFLKFTECPVFTIPGHKKDREIFESFYPIIDANMGMYFRVALAWLSASDSQRVALMLHISNRDFDTMRHLKIYVPVITNKDARMDIVAMSIEAFMLVTLSLGAEDSPPCYYKYDPRGGNRSPVKTREKIPPHSLEQIGYIRRVQYPEFYETMLSYIRTRAMSTGAYTCGQFLLDLHMRN